MQGAAAQDGYGRGMEAPAASRIASLYRERIVGGELSPGVRLPTVRELAAEHGIAQATAHKVVSMLQAEGLVTSKGRAGTVVVDPSASPPVSLVVDLGATSVEVLGVEVVQVSEQSAAELGARAGSSVVVLRLRTS